MSTSSNRREFLAQVGAAAVGAAIGGPALVRAGERPPERPTSRVVIGRDEAIARGKPSEHSACIRTLLDAALQRLTGSADADAAWRALFRPSKRIGIKVNTLGFSTQPVVVDAIVAGLRRAGVPAENILIWDRFDAELVRAKFRLNKSSTGVRCHGTDADRIGRGYQKIPETSGRIGSCYSRIVVEKVDTLICVPVLKDHNLAGVSLGMKNFYGAIHNPNKYHDHNCDPYVADVVSHRFIAPKWRLTVVDATRGQYHAGPGRSPQHVWPFGGLMVGTDFVAVDAVAADVLEAQRRAVGLPGLADENRPPRHIATAGARGLGEADLKAIERIEV
jgi:uncharacterized protein (DUF362 family)